MHCFAVASLKHQYSFPTVHGFSFCGTISVVIVWFSDEDDSDEHGFDPDDDDDTNDATTLNHEYLSQKLTC